MDVNQFLAYVRALQQQQLQQQLLLLQAAHQQQQWLAAQQQLLRQQQAQHTQHAIDALTMVVQSPQENGIQEAHDFSSLMCVNSKLREALLAAAAGPVLGPQLYLDLSVLTVKKTADAACGWLSEHMQLMRTLRLTDTRMWKCRYEDHMDDLSQKFSSVLAEAEEAHPGSVAFQCLELPVVTHTLVAQLPVSLTRLEVSDSGSSSRLQMMDHLSVLTSLKELAFTDWSGATSSLLPFTALPALTQLNLQSGAADGGAVGMVAGDMGEDFAPVVQALPVSCANLHVEQQVSPSIMRLGTLPLCMTGVSALARLTMLTQLRLLGCSAVDGDHTGVAAKDAQVRQGKVWPVTPQQLAACLQQLPQLFIVHLKNFRLQREQCSAAGGGTVAAGASSSAGAAGVGIAEATGADMLPVAEALAGLPRLTKLCCYNVTLGAAAQGLRAASKLRILELKECHVNDVALGGMLQGFGSSSSLVSLDLSRQHWQGVSEAYHGHVWSRSPSLTQASLDALRTSLPNLQSLFITAQPNITLEACHQLIAQWPTLSCIYASDHRDLHVQRCVYRGRSLHPYKLLRGSRDNHHAYGYTGSDSDDEEYLQGMEAAMWAGYDEPGWSDDYDDYGYPF